MDISNEMPKEDQTVPNRPVDSNHLDANVNNLEIISKAGFQTDASSFLKAFWLSQGSWIEPIGIHLDSASLEILLKGIDDVHLENNDDFCLNPPVGFTPPKIENALRDIPCFILCTHYLILPRKEDDYAQNEEKMKVEYIQRLDRILEKKKFYLEPAEVIKHNTFQRLESGLPNEQEKQEWKMHWLEPSFHCVFFYWRRREIEELLGKI